INIEPTKDIPPPYDTADVQTSSFVEELAVVANTQDLLDQLGPPPEISPEDAVKTASLLDKAVKNQDKGALASPPVAFAAREFLRVYSGRIAAEMSDVRAALTNKLLELANCGDPRFELKALELLGKHSDIALFTERSEVTVTYKNSSDLETAIKERVKRLLNARDITPPENTVNANNLDDVLGIVDMGTPVEVNAEATVDESEDKKSGEFKK
ncbi:MAG: hypothetical protein ACOYNN_12150, partial [Terrimicrobiaceae bacterium]